MSGATGVTVLIAERHRAVAESLSRVVVDLGGAEVTGQATSFAEAIELGDRLAPDIALVDLALSPSCELVTGLREVSPETRIIVMGDQVNADPLTMVKALESGAVGAIYKQASLEEIGRAVRQSSRATPVISEDATGLLLGSYLDTLVEKHQRDMSTIEALAAALEVRDMTTGEHVRRVTELAQAAISQVDPELGKNEEVSFGFMLHDVGKIGVPDAILNKAGPLSETEWEVMRKHPEIGVRIIDPLGFSPRAKEVILHHHERWDGSGYPAGLAGEEIPVAARAFAVVDSFDAMSNDRPYRPAMSRAEVHSALEDGKGTMYDPEMVEVVLDLT